MEWASEMMRGQRAVWSWSEWVVMDARLERGEAG